MTPQNLFFYLFLFFNFFLSNSLAFEVSNFILYPTSQTSYLISFNFKNFPLQEVILALKRQKREVLILYEFELYKKKFFKDELIHKESYYQRSLYLPEKNLYLLEDNFHKNFFENPEDLVLNLLSLNSYSLRLPEKERNLYLLVQVTLKYSSHLNKNLRYTSKEKDFELKTSFKYEIF